MTLVLHNTRSGRFYVEITEKLCAKNMYFPHRGCVRTIRTLYVYATGLNSTIPRAHCSVISYFGFRFTTAYSWMLYSCLQGDVEISCHKHFVVVPRHQQIPTRVTNLPQSGGPVLITPGGRGAESTRWSEILVENHNFCLPPK